MWYLKLTTLLLAIGVVAGSSIQNWHTQVETQRKLDDLNKEIAQLRDVVVQPTHSLAIAPQPGFYPGITALYLVGGTDEKKAPRGITDGKVERASAEEAQPVPREYSGRMPTYVIEAPDVLHIQADIRDPNAKTTAQLPTQPVNGAYLVRPDGTVGLGKWGSVPVAGLSVRQAIQEVEHHLRGEFELKPFFPPATKYLDVNVDVAAYNSKAFYLITNTGEQGEQVFRYPCTGYDTILDAISTREDLLKVKEQLTIQLTRKGVNGTPDQVLPINWDAISMMKEVRTNYLLLPGDRIHVKIGK